MLINKYACITNCSFAFPERIFFHRYSFAEYLTSPDTLISICLGVILRMIQNPLQKNKEQLQGDLKNTYQNLHDSWVEFCGYYGVYPNMFSILKQKHLLPWATVDMETTDSCLFPWGSMNVDTPVLSASFPQVSALEHIPPQSKGRLDATNASPSLPSNEVYVRRCIRQNWLFSRKYAFPNSYKNQDMKIPLINKFIAIS